MADAAARSLQYEYKAVNILPPAMADILFTFTIVYKMRSMKITNKSIFLRLELKFGIASGRSTDRKTTQR